MTQNRSKAAQGGELLAIQYLRGLAALTVLVCHNLQWPLHEMSAPLLRGGRLGVEVFFVISGFIITMVGGDGAFDVKSFLRRRALRIVPLYWGATIAVTVLALALPSLFRTTVPTLLGFVESLLFIPSEMPKAPLLGVGWTLDYEIFFYVLFAALAMLRSEARTACICATLFILIAIGASRPQASMLEYFYTSPSLLGFGLGTLLAQAHRHGLLARLKATPTPVAIGLPLALCVLFFVIPATDDGRAPLYFHIAMSMAAIAIVGGALAMESGRRLPTMPVLHYLGDASYAVYLFHLFAIGAGWGIAHRLWPSSSTPLYFAVALITGAAALATGLAAHHLFERPLLKACRSRQKPVDMPVAGPAAIAAPA